MTGDLDLGQADLHLRLWSAHARILECARELVDRYELDHAHVLVLEAAALHGDQEDLERAVAGLLEEFAARSG